MFGFLFPACLVPVQQKSTVTGPSLDGPDRYVKTTPIFRLDVPKKLQLNPLHYVEWEVNKQKQSMLC